MDCIFCKIVKGEIPSYTVYEDELVKVFLDVNPVTEGHMLVVPKYHYKDINDIPIGILTHCQEVARRMFKGLKETLKVEGLSLTQNNEYGQEIKHYHLHLIPRYKNDNINFIPQTNKRSVEEIYKEISK